MTNNGDDELCECCGKLYVDERQQLIDCLRALVDFSVDDPHYRYNEHSKAARQAAHDLLNRIGGSGGHTKD